MSAALAGAASGCHGVKSSDPLPTARRFLELASDGDHDAAYALLSEDFRARCDRACFAQLLRGQRLEMAQARAQVRAGEARVVMRAELGFPDGSALSLSESGAPLRALARPGEADGTSPALPYLFVEDPLDFYPQDTPEHALKSFMRAAMSRRYEPMLHFLPESLSGKYTVESLRERFDGPQRPRLLAQMEAVRRHLSEPITVDKDGRTARLPVGEGKEARLVLQDGRWRVQQLE